MIRKIALILFASSSAVFGQGAHYTYPFKIECPDYRVSAGDEVTINAHFEGGHTGDKYSPTYNWSVSMGTIVNGQGTSSITIKVGEMDSGMLTTSLVRTFAEAHYPGVQVEANCNFEVASLPAARMTDEFRTGGSNCEEGFARLDSFFTELSNNPVDQGLIVTYGDTRDPKAARRRELQLRNHFIFRKFPNDRVTIIRGIPKENGTTQFWLVPPGAANPELERAPESIAKPIAEPYLYAANYQDGVPGCSGHIYDVAEYAGVLKDDPSAMARIVIHESSRVKYDRVLKDLVRELTKLGIERRRITSVYKYVRPRQMLEVNELWIIPGKR